MLRKGNSGEKKPKLKIRRALTPRSQIIRRSNYCLCSVWVCLLASRSCRGCETLARLHTHTHTPLVFLYSSNWEEVGCTLLRTEILAEWVDCRGVSTVPCLRAQVNLTASNQTAFLHFDEEPVLHALEVRISGASSQRRPGSPPEERERKKKAGLRLILGWNCQNCCWLFNFLSQDLWRS